MQGEQTVLTPPSHVEVKGKAAKGALDGPKTFAFDKSYWSFNRADPNYAGQENLFVDLGKPLLDNAFQGYNNCIFAYGQTGSGKSYSMMGYGQESGIIPKICQNMFERIGQMQQDANLSCTVEVSYLEIYNERVRDLLNPSTKGNLRVREHPSTGPYVEDLAKLVVRSFSEIENLMDEGNKARTVAATNMNETSSRSHAVFTLTLTQKRHDTDTNMSGEKVAKISLVDLAGSERATSTGATGARLKEGAEINRSLSTLGRVIAALADRSTGKKKNVQVPYRDSVLTWLLKDSLGGNSLTAMIAAISPADINFEETLSTLRYADSAKRIKNHAVVNEDPNARMIRELKEELAQLRSKLSGGGGGMVEEQYAPDTPLEKQIVSIAQPDGTVKKVSKAEIVEQLSQSEKLYKDLNQTWEEKLQKTEEIHKEREAALEELGISIEKGFVGLSTPKKMPHLVNLSDDPLLAECLVYNLKPGTTTVGNVDKENQTAEIRLNGAQILDEHCTFENVDGTVTVVPRDNAGVMVNGVRIDKPKRLRSGYRIILGDFHIFRFNNPQEARAERAEVVGSSLLRHSVTPSQLNSPSPRPPGHNRTYSTVSNSEFGSESPRPMSPALVNGRGRDFEWSFARREAVTALLGTDQKIASLSDEDLDVLFEDLQKLRANRKARPESRMAFDNEEDMESVSSYPIREKYASTGTIDNFSLDTALTIPSTPQLGEEDDRLRTSRDDMQEKLEKQKEEFQAKLKADEEANVEIEEIKAEKAKMEETLKVVKEEMQKKLEEQKEEFDRHLKELGHASFPSTPKTQDSASSGPTERQLELARDAFKQWRERKYVAMAETILQNAATLKEAQVMSQQMDKNVVFQFCVVDVGHTFGSSYDLVLNGISAEDDEFLDRATKPCVGVRVVDFRNQVVHLWSIEKLRFRVRLMHQVHQYMNRPEYLQHFSLENPFTEPCMPEFSRIGDVDVPLAAVFESRVQDFTLDVISPHTTGVVGIIHLALEPSSAEAPSTTLKFNVVMQDLIGFPEREGTQVHAQLFLPGISDESGATTTQMISDFDEGPVRFESVHSMSLPYPSPRTTFLRVSIFAKVTTMHLDKLLSWDDMRDSAPKPKQKRRTARLPESEFFTEDTHDIFSRIQVTEISEDGTYQPVEVVQSSALDPGTYQLHQGLQRRIVVNLTHTSGETLKWEDVTNMRIGRVRLIDAAGNSPTLDSPVRDVPVKLVASPIIRNNEDGTSNVTFVGQWDSSMHRSLLLDRATPTQYRVQATLMFDVTSPKLAEPMVFSLDLYFQIKARSYITKSSMWTQLLSWSTTRIVHSTVGTFAVAIRPVSVKRATDLWRMNTKDDYVKGEEALAGWTPRGVSLVRDFIAMQKRKARIAEIETARSVLSSKALTTFPRAEQSDELDERQKDLLRRVLELWNRRLGLPAEIILNPTNLEPPRNGAAFAPRSPLATPSKSPSTPSKSSTSTSNGNTNGNGSLAAESDPMAAATPVEPVAPPSLLASVRFISKNPTLLKGGYLLMPDPTNTKWIRRFVELRKPYLHVHSVPEGDEINAINMSSARVDHSPSIARLLSSSTSSSQNSRNGHANGDGAILEQGNKVAECVFAIFAKRNTYLLRARSEREKIEWILRIDQSYFSSSGEASEGEEGADYGFDGAR